MSAPTELRERRIISAVKLKHGPCALRPIDEDMDSCECCGKQHALHRDNEGIALCCVCLEDLLLDAPSPLPLEES